MNNIKVRTKHIIVMVVSILALTACVTFSNNCMEKMKKNGKRLLITIDEVNIIMPVYL